MLAVTPIPGFFEPFGSMLHLLAAAVVAAFGAGLVRRGHGGARLALAGFVLAATTMLATSGTYHLLDDGSTGRAVLRRLDYAAIWIMIAASFTAIHCVAFRGPWRWAFSSAVWVLAITALVLELVFFDALPESVGLGLYLAMGWLGVITATVLWRTHGRSRIYGLMLGGLAYSAGAVYDYIRGPALIPDVIGPHEVFHIAVVLGVAIHWRFIGELAQSLRCWAPAGPA